MRGIEVFGNFRTLWEKGKFALPVLGLGVLLLLWPSGAGETKSTTSQETTAGETMTQQQKEMERILARIEGAGELHLMLTLERDGERTLAEDTEETLGGSQDAPESQSRRETVVLSVSGGEEVVVTRRESPVYRGALVVCQGADRAEVKLAVTQAVAALTGLGADRITVVKCQ